MILCFDISSGGVSAALFDLELHLLKSASRPWPILLSHPDAPPLTVDLVLTGCKEIVPHIGSMEQLTAICIGTFMHNCVLLDAADQPLTPVLTWIENDDEIGVDPILAAMGDRFFDLTGCRFHPMYPIFKLAALRQREPGLTAKANRVVSIKSILIHRLTGVWVEDHGMASASGLCNLITGKWDLELLQLVKLPLEAVPEIATRSQIVGDVTREGASDFGVPEGAAVVNGSGDGFLASVGSECETPERISVTLGTSAVARRAVSVPVLNRASGTFCYRATEESYLLGCAGNNGGNVLDWSRRLLQESGYRGGDIPIFIPLLHGERSPEWDPRLTASWHGLTARHTAGDLKRSVLEGVVFNLAYFVEILQNTLDVRAKEIVLSGRGFLDPFASAILATVVRIPVLMPENPGNMSLRGAAVCAGFAVGSPVPPLVMNPVVALEDVGIPARYQQYKEIRTRRHAGGVPGK